MKTTETTAFNPLLSEGQAIEISNTLWPKPLADSYIGPGQFNQTSLEPVAFIEEESHRSHTNLKTTIISKYLLAT